MTALKPFQHVGAQFLAGRTRALLADEPGVGKTAQIITACNLVGARRVQVICPDIGIAHWEREITKWGLQGGAIVRSWGDAHKLRDLLERDGGPKALPRQWDVLIADESHFGKNPQARRAKAVFGNGGLGWYARRIWAASGTPSPNGNITELWPMLRAFGKTKMDLATFTNYFCVVDGQGKVRGNRPDHVDEMRAILKTFMLRRLKKDVLPELGEIDVQEWYVRPSTEFVVNRDGGQALHLEAQLRAELSGKSEEDLLNFLSDHGEEFATLRRYNALLKAPAVYDTVRFELENRLLDKVVIYAHHTEAMRALHAAFERAKIRSTLITGETPRVERDGRIESWKRNGQVMIASLVIASTVLDFTAAHQGIMLELDWVDSSNTQAMQRMHRHGQTNPVTVRVALGTPIDEVVNSVLLRKTKAFSEVFDRTARGHSVFGENLR